MNTKLRKSGVPLSIKVNTNEYWKEYRKLNLERKTEIERKSRLKGKEKKKIYSKQYHAKYRWKYNSTEYLKSKGLTKYKCRQIWKEALKTGKVKRQPCEVCGNPIAHGHHYKGYEIENALEVKWLCPKHHGEIHRRLFPSAVNIIKN